MFCCFVVLVDWTFVGLCSFRLPDDWFGFGFGFRLWFWFWVLGPQTGSLRLVAGLTVFW